MYLVSGRGIAVEGSSFFAFTLRYRDFSLYASPLPSPLCVSCSGDPHRPPLVPFPLAKQQTKPRQRFSGVMTIPRLRTAGLSAFTVDLKVALGDRFKLTFPQCLAAKGLPAIQASATGNLGSVSTWIKASPARHLDPAGSSTNSIMSFGDDILSFGDDIFAHLQDMSPLNSWQGASFPDVLAALKALEASLSARDLLPGLDAYLAVSNVQRTMLLMLLRVIVDDLHGADPAVGAPLTSGPPCTSVLPAPASFAASVLAHAQLTCPWLFEAPPPAGPRLPANPVPEPAVPAPGDPVPQDDDIPPADSQKRPTPGGGDRPTRRPRHADIFSASRAIVTNLAVTSKTKLSGHQGLEALTSACANVECVNDVDDFVNALAELNKHIAIAIHDSGTTPVEMDEDRRDNALEIKVVRLFQAISRQLGDPVFTSSINAHLLLVLRTIVTHAARGGPQLKELATVASATRDAVEAFFKDASKESNLNRLRGISGNGFVDLNEKDRALHDMLAGKFASIGGHNRDRDRDRPLPRDRDRARGGDRCDRDAGRGRDYDRGRNRDRDKDRDRGDRDRFRREGSNLMRKLVDLILAKKDMARNRAHDIAKDLADGKCLGCGASMREGRCSRDCDSSKIRPAVITDLAKKAPRARAPSAPPRRPLGPSAQRLSRLINFGLWPAAALQLGLISLSWRL